MTEETRPDFGGATAEEFKRVHETECEIVGHDFQVIAVNGVLDPKEVICGRCGKRWSIAVLTEEELDRLRSDSGNKS